MDFRHIPEVYNRYREETDPNRQMSLSLPLLHRVIAEVHCEQKDCVDSAAWIVGLDKSVQFLCKVHTIECMSDTAFWRPPRGRRTRKTPA